MPKYRYLIVGGGMTADAAVQGIRQVDADGSIGLVSAESVPPYQRPPLSKGLWKGQRLENVWRNAAVREAVLHLGRKVVSLDPEKKLAVDDVGEVYVYEKLLLATGCTPRRLPSGPDSIIYFRALNDYLLLRLLASHKQRFAVIGGGFIGSEIAAALALNGKQVVMIFPDQAIGARMFPPDLAQSINESFTQHGVDVRSGREVVSVEVRDGGYQISTRGVRDFREEQISVDAVVAGLSVRPNTELAEKAGLKVGNGIRVDVSLRTSHADIYAAGDVAEFFNPSLEKHLRVEHEDNANTMGLMAGQAMAGSHTAYEHLPYFYSDLFDVGYEAVGEVDSQLETLADWKEPYREGVVYYLRDGRVRGVLLWNVWERVEAARGLIAAPGPFRAEDLKGRLLEVHEPV